MTMSISRASIRRPVAVWLAIIFCLLGGLWGLNTVGRLEDPSFTLKTALVFVPYPGATAMEVEEEVTDVVESALQQMKQLDRVESKSMPGMAQITVEIEMTYGPDEIPQVWDEMRRRIRDIEGELPSGAQSPIINDDFGDVYGMFYAVTADGLSASEQRDLATKLRRDLVTVDGVAKIEVQGLAEEEIIISIPSARLTELGLPPDQILGIIADENQVFSNGEISEGLSRLGVSVPPGYVSVEGIEALRLGAPGEVGQIALYDIARVVREETERPSQIVRHNGTRAFTLGVSALVDRNVVEVGRSVEARLDQLKTELPDGVEIVPIYEQHKVVDEAVSSFLVGLGQSVAIVIGALMLTMGWRAGLVVGATLGLTVFSTLFFMSVFGIEMERISLGALIIAMGMLVDNAIVIAEGMLIGMARGKSAEDAAADTETATGFPLLGATVIGIMAFSGIGLSPDATGEFLFSLFAVIAISLLMSWILAVTVTPYLGKLLLKAPRDTSKDPYRGLVYSAYRGFLWMALRARVLVVLTVVGITVWSVMAFGQVKQAFFPASNTPIFYVEFQMPQGTDIRATNEEMARLEAIILGEEIVTDVTTLVGRGASRFMLTYNPEQADASYGQLIVRATDATLIPDVAARLNRELPAQFPNALIRVEEIVFGPPAGADVAVRFSGPDPVVLRQLSDNALAIFDEAGTITNPRTDWRQREILVEPIVDEARMRLAGATRGSISDTVQYGTSGLRVGTLREGDAEIPMYLRLPEVERDGLDRLRDLSVWSPGANGYVPMANLVSGFEPRLVEALIHRRDRERTITVLGGAGGDLTADEAFRSVRSDIEAIRLPEGYTMEWGGEFESAGEAQASLGKQLPLGFLVMLTISILMFNKVRQPLILWLVVPMSVTGMVLGLLFTGLPFTFTALLGFLSLSGMLMKNAIVLVEEIDQQRAEGVEDYQAVIDGSVSRLRPVVLAAGTTIFGMTPLISDAFFASMAVTIMGGLAFASILTLVAVPVLYALFFLIKPPKQENAPSGSPATA
ncbi:MULTISPECIES: efflux RND transporter permease subunit [Rhodobacterales]|uniref:efflux RND transporter permease subunit n=1 Tax=Rhodobacterales TaxID=204455 RepID=UPI00126974A5|nr:MULTISPECIES: efflux RND transporter permease subunit [Roseobacteraceae]MCE8529874.1 efflux RND transporter permease subunit [Ruegeria pomeroyi]MDE4063009.1 efflux RND transporter permease subunit [Phaeobacter gallaeciensis]MDE4126030.1 efflux RND transporter permease subunit [Phaeobacter gallaeciensis]MDE4130494.1 efflux RND transporter permease subunit [Phaeobacter gallaeciensis]MDF3362682.1 efflux RND transporter permease subunit [Sulfitobacter sp. Ks41]